MSHKDISSMYSELDTDVTGDISTSLATDLSLSAGEETDENRQRKSRQPERRQPGKITRQLIERKQLLHDLQLAKIELSQKSLIIDNLKAEHLSTVEELEERLGNATHTKQILQVRIVSLVNFNFHNYYKLIIHFDILIISWAETEWDWVWDLKVELSWSWNWTLIHLKLRARIWLSPKTETLKVKFLK